MVHEQPPYLSLALLVTEKQSHEIWWNKFLTRVILFASNFQGVKSYRGVNGSVPILLLIISTFFLQKLSSSLYE